MEPVGQKTIDHLAWYMNHMCIDATKETTSDLIQGVCSGDRKAFVDLVQKTGAPSDVYDVADECFKFTTVNSIAKKSTKLSAQADQNEVTLMQLLLGSRVITPSDPSSLENALIAENELSTTQKQTLNNSIPGANMVVISQGMTPPNIYDTIKLGRPAITELIKIKQAHLAACIVPDLEDVPTDELNEHIANSICGQIRGLKNNKNPDPALLQLQRLMGPDVLSHFEAVYNPETKILQFYQPTLPLHRDVQKQIDPKQNTCILDRLIKRDPDVPLDISFLAKRMPTNVLTLLNVSGFEKVAIVPSQHYLGPIARMIDTISFGVPLERNPLVKGTAKVLDLLGVTLKDDIHSQIDLESRDVHIPQSPFKRDEHLSYAVACGITQALTFALGEGNELSKQSEFVNIFNRTQKSMQNGYGHLLFINDHSSISTEAMLIEALVAYLGLNNQNAFDHVKSETAADLKRLNPDLFNAVEDVFVRRVPEALKERGITPLLR